MPVSPVRTRVPVRKAPATTSKATYDTYVFRYGMVAVCNFFSSHPLPRSWSVQQLLLHSLQSYTFIGFLSLRVRFVAGCDLYKIYVLLSRIPQRTALYNLVPRQCGFQKHKTDIYHESKKNPDPSICAFGRKAVSWSAHLSLSLSL